jgi:quercetin dioxygenase-like cupin family protein
LFLLFRQKEKAMKFETQNLRVGIATVASALLIAATSACAQNESKPDGAGAQDTVITPLMSKELANIPGKEGMMLTVEYAPGASTPPHRHNAHVFVYVLEGSITMQCHGADPVTLAAGQTFYESPNDVHMVSRNASSTKPAKFLVHLVKDKGVPPVLPAQ